MDTHIAAHPTLARDDALLSARLPGEPGAPPAPTSAASEPAPAGPAALPTRRKRGRGLLAGCSLMVLLAGSAVAFAVSPCNTFYPVPALSAQVHRLLTSAQAIGPAVSGTARQAVAATGLAHPKPLAPSAALADVAMPPPTPPRVREVHVPTPKDVQVRDLLALQPGAAASIPAQPPAAAALPPPPASVSASASLTGPAILPPKADRPFTEVVGEPGSLVSRPAAVPQDAPRPATPAAASPTPTLPVAPAASPALPAAQPIPPPAAAAPDVTAQVIAATVTPPPPPAPAVSQPAVTAPISSEPVSALAAAPVAPVAVQRPDPVAAALALRPGPMTPREQVEVVGLVTEMARIVQDLKAQNAQLRADVRRSSSETSARLDDFARRLSMGEARRAMAAASDDAAPGPAAAPPAAPGPTPSVLPISARSASFAITPPGSPSTPPAAKRYRVQAASPGLALLAEVDRGGGDGAQLQVAVGDTLPDLGRVKSIAQRGTAWVVTAERGAVQ